MEIGICCFAAQEWAKKLKDDKVAGNENEISDLFLAPAECEAIRKIIVMVYARELETLTFSQILDIMKRNLLLK